MTANKAENKIIYKEIISVCESNLGKASFEFCWKQQAMQAEHWWNNVCFFTRSALPKENESFLLDAAGHQPASISKWRMLCAWAEGARGTQGILSVPELKQQSMPLHSWALQGQGPQQRWLCKSFLSCSSTDNVSVIFSRKGLCLPTAARLGL